MGTRPVVPMCCAPNNPVTPPSRAGCGGTLPISWFDFPPRNRMLLLRRHANNAYNTHLASNNAAESPLSYCYCHDYLTAQRTDRQRDYRKSFHLKTDQHQNWSQSLMKRRICYKQIYLESDNSPCVAKLSCFDTTVD
jgi:hypothetical protein